MKRFLVIVLAFVVLVPSVFAQMGDARAKGMAGAMTAVGDDMNALFFNPAGLSFLRKGQLSIEGNLGVDLNQSGWYPWDGSSASQFKNAPLGSFGINTDGVTSYYYAYAQGETPRLVDFDEVYAAYPEALDALARADGQASFLSAPMDGLKNHYYQQLVYAYSLYNGVQKIVGNPRVTIGGPHWGLSAFAEYSLLPSYSGPGSPGMASTLDYDVTRRLGAVAGLGLSLGPVAIGVNAKYIQTASFSQSFGIAEEAMGLSVIQEILGRQVDAASEDSYFEIGLGALLSLGIANIGVYNDNLTPFLVEGGYTGNYIEDFLSTMNFGLAFMPSDNKFKKSKSPLQFIAAIDLKNFGDVDARRLCAGLEAGLNAGDFLVALARVGYTQPLPGELVDMANNFDPSLGTVTLGATARLWLAKIDAALSLPVSFLRSSYYYGDVADAQLAMDSMKANITVSLAF